MRILPTVKKYIPYVPGGGKCVYALVEDGRIIDCYAMGFASTHPTWLRDPTGRMLTCAALNERAAYRGAELVIEDNRTRSQQDRYYARFSSRQEGEDGIFTAQRHV